MQDKLKEKFIKEIKKQYGSINSWLSAHNIPSSRFYSWKKGDRSIHLTTFEGWLDTVGLEISLKNRKK